MKGARRSGGPGAASTSQRARLADEHHAKGYSLRKQGDFAAAIEEYSQAIALEPQHFKALFNRGFSWDKVHCTLYLWYAPSMLHVQPCAGLAIRLGIVQAAGKGKGEGAWRAHICLIMHHIV